jgi:Na+-driven multidrug efflux pump
LIVSGIVLHFSKRPISLVISLLSTVLFGVGMSWALYETWGQYECMSGIQFFGFALNWLSLMIPLWIIAIVLEVMRRRKNKQNPETSAQEQKPE